MKQPCKATFQAGMHRNLVIPPSAYDNKTGVRIIFDSALGQAEVRVTIGQPLKLEELEDESIDKELDKMTPDNPPIKTVQVDIFGQKLITPEPLKKKMKINFWPACLDVSSGGPYKNWMCREPYVNQSNLAVIKRLLIWKDAMRSIIQDVRHQHGFPDEACKEQFAMTFYVTDICESIAAAGLPVTLMGAKQMKNEYEHLDSIQEAELIENVAYYELFKLSAHKSACCTTFYIVTTHIFGDDRKHVLYGIFPPYQGNKPCVVEEMLDHKSVTVRTSHDE